MAKSIRSKRRQRVLSTRRERYREVERRKCWEHHKKIEAEKASGPTDSAELVPVLIEDEVNMDTNVKVGRKRLSKLSLKWASRRSKKKKAKRISRAAW